MEVQNVVGQAWIFPPPTVGCNVNLQFTRHPDVTTVEF
jgi:hypothetical protein